MKTIFFLVALSQIGVAPINAEGAEFDYFGDEALFERLADQLIIKEAEETAEEKSTALQLTGLSPRMKSGVPGASSGMAIDGKNDTCARSRDNIGFPYWQVNLRTIHCISKITIQNRADCCSENLANALARAGLSSRVSANLVCGGPVNVDQAAVLGGTIVFECDQPLKSHYVTIGIPSRRASLSFCEITIEEVPMEQCNSKEGPKEIRLRSQKSQQSSTQIFKGTRLVPNKAKDGNFAFNIGIDRACAQTETQTKPWWSVTLRVLKCISKVSVLNRGEGKSAPLANAVVRVGKNSNEIEGNPTCGSPVTAEQAAVSGGTVYFICDPPRQGKVISVDIPSEDATLQLCEVRAWEVPMDECIAALNADECDSSPCKNGATCVDGEMQFTCTCAGGFTGPLCEIDIDECEGDPCKNGATCVDGVGEFSCTCPPGFSGTLCETDIDECEGDPCQNGATCVDGVGEFSCTCPVGYSGTLCETNIDDCEGDPCKNDATCVDGVNQFNCTCAAGFTGPLCETDIDECEGDPCKNGATCVHGVNQFTCTCAAGFTGPFCETDIDDCVSGPCRNGATCVDGVNVVSCKCAVRFTGALCETSIAECSGKKCKNGICIKDGAGGVKCACSPGYEGPSCEIDINECDSAPCQNGGTCTDGVDEVSCTCAPGFSGLLCEKTKDSNPVLQVKLTREFCIRKITILERGDCTSDRLTGAVVRAGTSSIGSANRVCGSAVSATLALERRAFLDFVCDPPLSAKYVSVDIPQIRITKEQLCEVTVEEATPGPC